MEEKKDENATKVAQPKKKKKKLFVILGIVAVVIVGACLFSFVESRVRMKKAYDKLITDNVIAEEYEIVYFAGRDAGGFLYWASGSVSIKQQEITGYLKIDINAGSGKTISKTIPGICGLVKQSDYARGGIYAYYYFAQKESKNDAPEAYTHIWVYPSAKGEILYFNCDTNIDLGGGMSFNEMVLRKKGASQSELFSFDGIKTGEMYDRYVDVCDYLFDQVPVIESNELKLVYKVKYGSDPIVDKAQYSNYTKSSDGLSFEHTSGNDNTGYSRTKVLLLTENDFCYIVENSSSKLFNGDKKGSVVLCRK